MGERGFPLAGSQERGKYRFRVWLSQFIDLRDLKREERMKSERGQRTRITYPKQKKKQTPKQRGNHFCLEYRREGVRRNCASDLNGLGEGGQNPRKTTNKTLSQYKDY